MVLQEGIRFFDVFYHLFFIIISHKKKRMKQIKKMISRGLYDPESDNPFDLFISSTEIRWCYYKESHKILGQTYGMCVLQDFEALTPNLLCRTIETVEGGGMVVLLLRTMMSLRQLYTMTMDTHSRFRTEAHNDVVARFNERFILSLSNCEGCVILDISFYYIIFLLLFINIYINDYYSRLLIIYYCYI